MTILLQTTALLNALLGLLTFVSKRDSVKNFYFLLTSAGIAGWAYTNSEFQTAVDANNMHLWAIVAYQVATFMLFSVRLFSYSIVYGNVQQNKIRFWFSLLALGFGAIAPMVPGLISKGVNFQQKSIIAGPFQLLIFVVYIFLIVDSLSTLFSGIKITSKQKEKSQLKLVFVGLSGAVVAGVTTNIVMPAIGIYDAVATGPSFTLILLSLVAYAIVRHQFLDVRILFGRIFYFMIMASLPYSIFFLLVYVYEQIFGTVFHPLVYFLSGIVGVAFVVAFNNLEHYIKTQITTRLLNPGYNPIEIIKEFGDKINTSIKIEDIAAEFSNIIKQTLRPEYSYIILFPDQKRFIQPVFAHKDSTIPYPETDFMPLHAVLMKLWENVSIRNIFILPDELEFPELTPKSFPADVVTKLLEQTQKLRIKLIYPIQAEGRIAGAFILGSKESEAFYNSADKEFIASLFAAAGAGIQRTLLYYEVQQFTITLQSRVDEATSELTRANIDLQEALRRVQEARQREHDMMDVMGHELRTPISIVRNALAMLRREAQLAPGRQIPEEKLNKYIDMGLESSRREITLIETLLSSTKIDASRLQLYFTRVDFKDVVNDAMEGQRMNIGQKPLVIQYYPPKNEITVYCDRTRVQEIMDNFLSNAVKYTLQGTILISQWNDENFGYISVKDTGIGVDEEDLQKLGKKFFRAKQYIKGSDENQVVRPGGTGLGLYVTFELIRAMGGRLWINSHVGKGTNFTFSMPLYRGEKDKQFDQTFEEGVAASREFITINGEAPVPAGTARENT